MRKLPRVLIVEDIVTTGGSVQEVVNVVKKAGGVIVGVGLLVDRRGAAARREPDARRHEEDRAEPCPQAAPHGAGRDGVSRVLRDRAVLRRCVCPTVAGTVR